MKTLKSTHPRRDRHRPEEQNFTYKTCKKALRIIRKHGLNSQKIQRHLQLASPLEADKLIFILQSRFSKKMQKSLLQFRSESAVGLETTKWERNPEKDIQSLEYYLSL